MNWSVKDLNKFIQHPLIHSLMTYDTQYNNREIFHQIQNYSPNLGCHTLPLHNLYDNTSTLHLFSSLYLLHKALNVWCAPTWTFQCLSSSHTWSPSSPQQQGTGFQRGWMWTILCGNHSWTLVPSAPQGSSGHFFSHLATSTGKIKLIF